MGIQTASIFFLALSLAACGDSSKKEEPSNSGQSYDFSATASVELRRASDALGLNGRNQLTQQNMLSGPKHICETGQTITCAAPTKLTGKYLGAGLLIQSAGKGMLAYLMGEEWASLDGASTSYSFDFESPVKSSGKLKCCGGTGDLSGEESYFSNGAFLFGYVDATFKIPYSTSQLLQVPAAMKESHSVRFVMADGILPNYRRGDLLYKDTDETFKWVDSSSGALSASRPTSPVTMDTKVVNYTQPFEGFSSPIPIIYTEISEADGKVLTSQDKLKAEGKTYSFDYDATYALVFMLAPNELTIIQSVKEMLARIHMQGLPHTKFEGFGAAAVSKLTIQ